MRRRSNIKWLKRRLKKAKTLAEVTKITKAIEKEERK